MPSAFTCVTGPIASMSKKEIIKVFDIGAPFFAAKTNNCHKEAAVRIRKMLRSSREWLDWNWISLGPPSKGPRSYNMESPRSGGTL